MINSTYQIARPGTSRVEATSDAILRSPGADGFGEGFRVTWELSASTVQGDFPLHLDGLLASVAFHTAKRVNPKDAFAARLRLPLERGVAVSTTDSEHEEFVFATSQIIFLDPHSAASPQVYTHNTSVADMARDIAAGTLHTRKSAITLGTGPDKLYLLMLTPQRFLRAVAYGIGSIEEIRSMLNQVTHLGSERRLGFGNIRSCTVVPDERASELWRCRSLPLSMQGWSGEHHYRAQGTARPDYFAREQREECYEWRGQITSSDQLDELTV